jgi:hypothetical protein
MSITPSVSTSGRNSAKEESLHIYRQREKTRIWGFTAFFSLARVLEMETTTKVMASGLLLLLLVNVGKQLLRVVFVGNGNDDVAHVSQSLL